MDVSGNNTQTSLDRAVLADPMRPCRGLQVVLRVVIAVHEDDRVRTNQVEALEKTWNERGPQQCYERTSHSYQVRKHIPADTS